MFLDVKDRAILEKFIKQVIEIDGNLNNRYIAHLIKYITYSYDSSITEAFDLDDYIIEALLVINGLQQNIDSTSFFVKLDELFMDMVQDHRYKYNKNIELSAQGSNIDYFSDIEDNIMPTR